MQPANTLVAPDWMILSAQKTLEPMNDNNQRQGIARENESSEPFFSLVMILLTACGTLPQGMGDTKMASKPCGSL